MKVGLLGPVEVTDDDGAPVALAGHKARILLAVLACQANRPVSAGAITEALWGMAPPRQAPSSLRVYVHHLRRALGDSRIGRRAGGYSLRVEPGELDVDRFRELAAQGRDALSAGCDATASATFREALALWRGPALAGVDSVPTLGVTAAALEELRLEALEQQFAADLALGRTGEIIAELRTLVERHPFRESMRALLMRALAGGGRGAEAAAVFEDGRRLLARELGLDPGPALRELHMSILRDDPAIVAAPSAPPADATARPAGPGAPSGPNDPSGPSRPSGPNDPSGPDGPGRPPAAAPGPAVPAAEVPRQLPARSAGFAGRVAWLARLDALLPPGDDRPGGLPVATISGVPGIGKTTLAVHWAHRVADRFPDGQLYLDLRGFDPDRPPVDPATGLAILLGALGVAGRRLPASQPERESLYRTVLADRRVLLVLDNAHDAAQVRPLLPGGDRCLVLVTSRNPLAGLVATGARPMVLDLLGPAEAGDLLEGRLGRARVAAEPDAVAGIADRCGGLPLALSIVAARAAVRDDAPLGAVVAELGRSRRTLDEFAGDDASADLRAVFSWSYRILGEPAARLLRLLAVHPGPDVTAPAAASLAGTPVPEAHAALRELHAASLLTEVRPDRYAFHDLVRAYAAELAGLSDPPERLHAALVRLLDHLVHTALAATLSLDPHQTRTDVGPAVPGVTPEPIADRREALVWFETERPVILAAVERAADGFESHAWRLAWTSVVYLERSGQWHDKLAVLSTALDAARRTGERTTQARTLRSLGRTLGRLHDYGAAYAHLRSAIALYRDLGDVNGQAHAAGSLGEILEHEGRYEEALAMDEESYELFAAAGNRLGQARALGGIGSLQTLMGRHEQTIATCQRALELFVAAGDRNGQAGVHDSLGVAYGHLGRHAEAVACFRQALEALESTGEQFYVALVLAHLGDEHLAAAEVVEARHCYDSALAIFTRLGSREAGAVRDKLALLEHGYFTPAAGA